MTKSKTAKPEDVGAVPLTDGGRIALASTALAILRLPSMLQQYSNACDMLDISRASRAGAPVTSSASPLRAQRLFRVSAERPSGS